MASNVSNHPLQEPEDDDNEFCDEDSTVNKEKASLLGTSGSGETSPGSSAPSSDWCKGLDHCGTAPVGLYGDMLINDNEINYTWSLIEKGSSPSHNLELDRLSEREKNNCNEFLESVREQVHRLMMSCLQTHQNTLSDECEVQQEEQKV